MDKVSYLTINGNSREIADITARQNINELQEVLKDVNRSSTYGDDGVYENVDARFEAAEARLKNVQVTSDSSKDRISRIIYNLKNNLPDDVVWGWVSVPPIAAEGVTNIEITYATDKDGTIQFFSGFTLSPTLVAEAFEKKDSVQALSGIEVSLAESDKNSARFILKNVMLMPSKSFQLYWAAWENGESIEVVDARINGAGTPFPILKDRLDNDYNSISNMISFSPEDETGTHRTLQIQPGLEGGIKNEIVSKATDRWLDTNYLRDVKPTVIEWMNGNYIDGKKIQVDLRTWMSDNYTAGKNIENSLKNWMTDNYTAGKVIQNDVKSWFDNNYTAGKVIKNDVNNWFTNNYAGKVVPTVNSWMTSNYTSKVDPTVTNWMTANYPAKVTPTVNDWMTNNYSEKVNPTVTSWMTNNYTSKVDPTVTSWMTNNYAGKVTPTVNNWMTTNYSAKVNPSVTSWMTSNYPKVVSPTVSTWMDGNYTNGKIIKNDIDNWLKNNISQIKLLGNWNSSMSYEAYSVVVDPKTSATYCSIKPVPAGTPLTDTNYWVVTSDSNAKLAQLEKSLNDEVTRATGAEKANQSAASKAQSTADAANSAVAAEKTRATNAEKDLSDKIDKSMKAEIKDATYSGTKMIVFTNTTAAAS